MNQPSETLLAACLSKYGQWYHLKLWLLVGEYDSLESLYSLYKSGGDIPDLIKQRISISWHEEYFQSMQNQLDTYGITPLLARDPEFPAALRAIDDCPYVIYYQGRKELLTHATLVSCVGTRNMSSYGKRVIDRLVGGLEGLDICIVSGLALGVDAYSHKVAIQAKLSTVAVLAGGLDRYEPLTNASLGKQIAEIGCMVSEYPPGVRPQKNQFLERNRIIAALSKATIIIEGKQHSGSLVTARLALKYGREVGVPPGDIFAENSQGPHYLLRDGAWPLCTHEDVCSMLGIECNPKDTQNEEPISQLLKSNPMSVDALQLKLGLPMSEIYEKLTVLELSGKIEALATGEYYLKKINSCF